MAWLQAKGTYWQAGFRDRNGKLIQRSTRVKVKGADRKDSALLKARAQAVAAKMEMAVRGEVGNQARFRKTLTDLVELASGESSIETIKSYSAEYLVRAEARYNESSFYGVKAVVRMLKEECGEDAAMDSVTSAQIQRIIDGRAKVRAAKTAARDRKFMSKFFADAVRQGIIDRNPVAATYEPSGESTTREPFTDSEIKDILGHCDDEWKRAVRVALMTGLRLSDATCLTRKHYDKALDAIRITERKTKKELTIPVNETLRGYMQLNQVCPTLSGMTTAQLGRRFDKILTAAGIDRMPEKHGRNTTYKKSFHSLRHNFVSKLANAGVDPEIRQKLAGHASVEVHSIYTHHNIDRMRAAIESIS